MLNKHILPNKNIWCSKKAFVQFQFFYNVLDAVEDAQTNNIWIVVNYSDFLRFINIYFVYSISMLHTKLTKGYVNIRHRLFLL